MQCRSIRRCISSPRRPPPLLPQVAPFLLAAPDPSSADKPRLACSPACACVLRRAALRRPVQTAAREWQAKGLRRRCCMPATRTAPARASEQGTAVSAVSLASPSIPAATCSPASSAGDVLRPSPSRGLLLPASTRSCCDLPLDILTSLSRRWRTWCNNLIKIYPHCHSRLIPYYSFEQVLHKAEKVGARNLLMVNEFIHITHNSVLTGDTHHPAPRPPGATRNDSEKVAFFFAATALMEYGLVTLPYLLVATSAALCTLKRSPIWDETLKHQTGFNELQVMEPAKVIVHIAARQSKLKALGCCAIVNI